MALNPYFSKGFTADKNEQALVNDLTIEVIQAHGVDFMYMPRKLISVDKLFGEDPTSEFRKAIEIEMYIENPTDYSGEGELMSKFGIEVRKELVMLVSVSRFEEVTNLLRPVEGDLLYLPLVNMYFQISFVEDEPLFWQLGSQYTYRVYARTFEYSHETVSTGFDDIDAITDKFFNDGTDTNGLANDRSADNETIVEVGEAFTDLEEESPFGKW